MAKPLPGRSFIGTLGLVFLAIAVIYVADTFLAKTERMEDQLAAERRFARARALMRRGENTEAIAQIKDAISIEPGNRAYLRELAGAQFAAGKTTDAEETLTGLLESGPTDGRTNLIMARVLVREGRFPDAISYYHRAIYGRWDQDEAENRLRARLELIDLLAKRNAKQELLAELLAVQDLAPHDPSTRMRLGKLFLLAGSPARAADVFRGILHDDPANVAAHSGLGEADFALGNYRAAQRTFQTALRLAPDDPSTRQRLEILNELLELDPTRRSLGAMERYRRSLKLVDLTLSEARECAGQSPPAQLLELLKKAEKTRGSHSSAAWQSEAFESNLDLAEQLWQVRRKDCKSPPPGDSPLAFSYGETRSVEPVSCHQPW